MLKPEETQPASDAVDGARSRRRAQIGWNLAIADTVSDMTKSAQLNQSEIGGKVLEFPIEDQETPRLQAAG